VLYSHRKAGDVSGYPEMRQSVRVGKYRANTKTLSRTMVRIFLVAGKFNWMVARGKMAVLLVAVL
jgi:hypothetical protein